MVACYEPPSNPYLHRSTGLGSVTDSSGFWNCRRRLQESLIPAGQVANWRVKTPTRAYILNFNSVEASDGPFSPCLHCSSWFAREATSEGPPTTWPGMSPRRSSRRCPVLSGKRPRAAERVGIGGNKIFVCFLEAFIPGKQDVAFAFKLFDQKVLAIFGFELEPVAGLLDGVVDGILQLFGEGGGFSAQLSQLALLFANDFFTLREIFFGSLPANFNFLLQGQLLVSQFVLNRLLLAFERVIKILTSTLLRFLFERIALADFSLMALFLGLHSARRESISVCS